MKTFENLFDQLKSVTGEHHVLIQADQKLNYETGFRLGSGSCLAVVLPQTLFQMWQTIELCVKYNVIMIPQAANTGVTGGSTPYGDQYDREIIIINTTAIKDIHLIDQQQQVIAFPGTSLTDLENLLAPYDKEPHSVIGSSCIGASVIGGICNNSGGSLIRRGPAFTEKSLFARINEQGQLELINELGIDLGQTPEEIFNNLSRQNYEIANHPEWQGRIWADNYADKLRQVDACCPTRFNGNPDYLHHSSGCSGKLAVFAVRLPTFQKVKETTTFYLGSNKQNSFIQLRRKLLTEMSELPYQAEYIHRGALDLTCHYSKYIYKAVEWFGAAKIPQFFALKNKLKSSLQKVPFFKKNSLDIIIHWLSNFIPNAVAPRIQDFRNRFEHHLMIKVDQTQVHELQNILAQHFEQHGGEFFQCNATEQQNAFLIRFGVGSCLSSYCDLKDIDPNTRIVTFDVALRANDQEWLLDIPSHLEKQILFNSSCGHFLCYVVHQEFILQPQVDAEQFKNEMLKLYTQRGGHYPAEHNVGHIYKASDEYKQYFQYLDPTNSFNPGIGKTSKLKYWK